MKVVKYHFIIICNKKVTKNSRAISLISLMETVYGRIYIARMKQRSEDLVSDEQGGIRSGREYCMLMGCLW